MGVATLSSLHRHNFHEFMSFTHPVHIPWIPGLAGFLRTRRSMARQHTWTSFFSSSLSHELGSSETEVTICDQPEGYSIDFIWKVSKSRTIGGRGDKGGLLPPPTWNLYWYASTPTWIIAPQRFSILNLCPLLNKISKRSPEIVSCLLC